MKKFFVSIVLLMFLSGCFTTKPYVLTESEQYYFIPKGTTFNAVVIDGQVAIPCVRDKDTWAVDAGYLAKLQEEANANALKPSGTSLGKTSEVIVGIWQKFLSLFKKK